MKILKARGKYLKEKVTHNSLIGIAFLAGFLILIASFFYTSLGVFSLIFSVIAFFASMSFFRKSISNLQGIQGEEEVIKALSVLDDTYVLINDVNLAGGAGNIDHIVLGPNGVFVIETKNYSGVVVCSGDSWLRHYSGTRRRRNFGLGSPSRQAKRNALSVKKVVESVKGFCRMNIWVDAVVVFPNPHVKLHLKNPTITILRSEELPNYILTRKLNYQLSPNEIREIGQVIMKESN